VEPVCLSCLDSSQRLIGRYSSGVVTHSNLQTFAGNPESPHLAQLCTRRFSAHLWSLAKVTVISTAMMTEMLSELGSGAGGNIVGVGAFERVVLVDGNDAVVVIATENSLALMTMPPTLVWC